MDAIEVVERIAAPVLTAVGAFIGAAFRFTKRITDVETKFESAQKSWREEMDGHQDEVFAKIKVLEAQLKEYENSFDTFRDSSHDFAKDSELARFIMEQHEQWQTIQRTLGYIEGLLKKSSSPPRP